MSRFLAPYSSSTSRQRVGDCLQMEKLILLSPAVDNALAREEGKRRENTSKPAIIFWLETKSHGLAFLRVMRYYYCCSGYEPLIASSSSRTILDAVADHVICAAARKRICFANFLSFSSFHTPSFCFSSATASSKLEMRECPSRNQPQSLNDFVYAIQVDLCRYGCIYQETVDEQR